ncbi:MAG: hypothetical protein M3429_07705 [Verrucomicrobiota bacterium]|nr:hypothetical protein [Verrucomicrobiota bacterium]
MQLRPHKPGARAAGHCPTKIHRLKVGYVAGASSIGGTTADSILAGATRSLRGVDSTGDSSADVVLQRDGAMRVVSPCMDRAVVRRTSFAS